jgi:hypothetical protein
MPAYKAPLDDIRFVLFDVLKADSLAELPGFADATQDLVSAVLEAAGEFAASELQPINHSGDDEGCHYENGTVTTRRASRKPMPSSSKAVGPACPAIRSTVGRACPR